MSVSYFPCGAVSWSVVILTHLCLEQFGLDLQGWPFTIIANKLIYSDETQGIDKNKYPVKLMIRLSDDIQADIIDAFNTTSRYLDGILNINNIYFDNMVS